MSLEKKVKFVDEIGNVYIEYWPEERKFFFVNQVAGHSVQFTLADLEALIKECKNAK